MNITETTTILKQNFSQAAKAIAIASSILIMTNNSVTAQAIESNNELLSPIDHIESEVVDGMEQVNSVSELIDINSIHRAELVELKRRLDRIETTIGQVEDTKFSTTSKLIGNLRVQTNTFFSGDGDPQTNMQYN